MLEPSPSLFYKICSKVFGDKSIFATRAITSVKVVSGSDKNVQTLAVGKEGVIFVNKDFWTKNVKTETDAAIVFIHELFHVVTGDTIKLGSLSKEEMVLANLSMDMRINSVVSNLVSIKYSMPYQACILTRLYKPFGVMGLLRRGSSYPRNSKYRSIYNSLYDYTFENRTVAAKTFKSEESIREALKVLIPKNSEQYTTLAHALFIGNHSGEISKDKELKEGKQQNINSEKDADVKESKNEETLKQKELKIDDSVKNEISDALSNTLHDLKAYGYSSFVLDSICNIVESGKSIDKKLLEKFSCNHKINQIKCFFEKDRRVSNVVPIRPSSRDMSMLASGVVPALWKNTSTYRANKNKNIAIYLDVSGSVTDYLPALLGIIRNFNRSIDKVYCFSNIISEHSMSELSNGKFKTTGGTDFDCVASHILSHKEINKVIILTDGYAEMDSCNQKDVEKQLEDAAVIYFGDYVNRNNFFEKKYKKGFTLQEITK